MKRDLPVVALALTAIASGLRAWPGGGDLLELAPAPILAGEAWRLVTGHFVHFGTAHAVGDILGFALWATVLEVRSRRTLIVCLAVSIPLVSSWILATLDEGESCRGLSGVATALAVVLFAEASVLAWRARSRWRLGAAGLAGACFVGKTLYETLGGTALLAPDLGEGVGLLASAHAAGILAGSVAFHWRRPPLPGEAHGEATTLRASRPQGARGRTGARHPAAG